MWVVVGRTGLRWPCINSVALKYTATTAGVISPPLHPFYPCRRCQPPQKKSAEPSAAAAAAGAVQRRTTPSDRTVDFVSHPLKDADKTRRKEANQNNTKTKTGPLPERQRGERPWKNLRHSCRSLSIRRARRAAKRASRTGKFWRAA